MKIGLETGFNSRYHWERLVEYSSENKLDYLMYQFTMRGDHWLYHRYPGIIPARELELFETKCQKLKAAGTLCKDAGMDFWVWYEAINLPDRISEVAPELFNSYGEPDMSGEPVYELLGNQIDELVKIIPNLTGISAWIMECAKTVVSRLKHQTISMGEIAGRIVETLCAKCREHNIELAVCLHTAGADYPFKVGLKEAVLSHDEIILEADDVIGDFSLCQPFQSDIASTPKNHPSMIVFDLEGEYRGRNFLPTSALDQFRIHIDKAKEVGVSHVTGRIVTAHDRWSPHFNALPSKRAYYLDGAGVEIKENEPLPNTIETCCFDTLGGFNTDFLINYIRDAKVKPVAVVEAFLKKEFKKDLPDLARVFVEVERVAAGIHSADCNRFSVQSVVPTRNLALLFGSDIQYTTPAGSYFPPPEGVTEPSDLANRAASGPGRSHSGGRMPGLRSPLVGHPVRVENRSIGPHALILEKQQALLDAEDLLERVKASVEELKPGDRTYIVDHFEYFVLFCRSCAVLLEAMVHYYHIVMEKKCRDIPDRGRFSELTDEIKSVAEQWKERQPHDEWKMHARLSEWEEEFERIV